MRTNAPRARLGKAPRYPSGRGSANDPTGRMARAYYLERLRRAARERGGRLLSRVYVNDNTKLRFRCAQGHEFLATPGKIVQGRWCRTCGIQRRAEMRKAPALDRLLEIVRQKQGLVLSPFYVNSQTRMRFRCAVGHEWEAVPGSILQGTWCKRCVDADARRYEATRREVTRRLQRIVRERDGELLSEYVNAHARLSVRCARGHVWETTAPSLDEGHWCRECKREDLLEELRRIAKGWGGECLSDTTVSPRGSVRMVCAWGHRWNAPVQNLKRGHWCPSCRTGQRGDIALAQRAASERGGVCLSWDYVNDETPLRWCCREGHEWVAPMNSILSGSWCRQCMRGWGRSRKRLSIEVMREMAAERGGKCLSKQYDGIYSALRWCCARGHIWTTKANNVRRGGWCPKCSHETAGTLDRMHGLAREHGGRCLTTRWTIRNTPLRFECRRGHRFSLHANVLKTGVWCPECGE